MRALIAPLLRFTSLTLRMKRVHSGLLEVEPIAVRTLDEMFDAFEARLADADYLVGWLDTFARGPALGRGLVHRADYLPPGEDRAPAQTLRVRNQELPPTLFGVVPKSIMWALMRPFTNDAGVRLVNLAKVQASRHEAHRRYRQPHAAVPGLLEWLFAMCLRRYSLRVQPQVPAAAKRAAVE